MTIEEVVMKYSDMLYRICVVMLGNEADAQDAVQDTFCRYLERTREFTDGEHEKAWFVRVTLNACKDWLRSLSRRQTLPLEVLAEEAAGMETEDRDLLAVVLSLPEKYRDVIYLHYYEGYSAVEIGKLLGRSENTVYTWLSRARAALKDKLGGDWP